MTKHTKEAVRQVMWDVFPWLNGHSLQAFFAAVESKEKELKEKDGKE